MDSAVRDLIQQNSLLFSLLAGNLAGETGSISTASATTQSLELGNSPRRWIDPLCSEVPAASLILLIDLWRAVARSASRIDRRCWRMSGLDDLCGREANILAKPGGHELHANRDPVDLTSRDCKSGQAKDRHGEHRMVRRKHPSYRIVALLVVIERDRP